MADKRARKTATRKTATRKNATLSRKKAHSAAKAAKRAYAKKSTKRSAGWKKGGKEWSRVMGHFGITLPGTHKR